MVTIKQIIADLDRSILARRTHLDEHDDTEKVYTEREAAQSELELVEIIRNDIADKLESKL